jgi:hypothetical protein
MKMQMQIITTKKKTKKIMAELDLNAIMSEVTKKTFVVVTEENQAKVTSEQGSRLVQEVARRKNITEARSFTGICIVAQKGGTSKRANGDVYANVDGSRITLADIRNAISSAGLKISFRQWARTYADNIHSIAELYGIQGDLAKKLIRMDANLTTEDLYWASNFQMDNENCPFGVRDLIRKHFEELFPAKS